MYEYQEMYLIMMRATEKAIQILVEAQQKCEELYINADKASVTPPEGGAEKDGNTAGD